MLVWVHDEALDPRHPIWRYAAPESPALFILDPDHLHERGCTMKEVAAQFDAAIACHAEVVRGDMFEAVTRAAHCRGTRMICTPRAVADDLKAVQKRLSDFFTLQLIGHDEVAGERIVRKRASVYKRLSFRVKLPGSEPIPSTLVPS